MSIHTLLQKIAPQKFLSCLVFHLTQSTFKPWKNFAIRLFIMIYKINTKEITSTNLNDYPTFNSFFTRALKNSCRTFPKNTLCIGSPVDGNISQLGHVADKQILQAKNLYYSVNQILGMSKEQTNNFQQGSFINIYLSPQNYHRIHMPIDGTLIKTCFIPGKLFSVSPTTTNNIPNLFARNERLVCFFKTAIGELAFIMVGAMLVSGIETVWRKSYKHKEIYFEDFSNSELSFMQGEEIGRFNMGSTVILLTEKKVNWCNSLTTDQIVKLGNPLTTNT